MYGMKKLKLSVTNIVFAILIVIAVGLAVAIWRQAQENKSLTENLSNPSPQATNTQADTIPTRPTAAPMVQADYLAKLTPDEKAALAPPAQNASQDQQKQFFDLVSKTAKTSDALDISQCKPNPVVMKVKYGGTFPAKNTDSVPHRIVFDKDHVYTIPANGQTAVEVNFGKAAGIYGYGCDSTNYAVGMLFTY